MKILVTGGYGFIGSNLIKLLMNTYQHSCTIINLDCLTYAARPRFIQSDIENFSKKPNCEYIHINADIRDSEMVDTIFSYHKPERVFHLAAESHVCNSIKGPRLFLETNIMGTFNLLEAYRKLDNGGRFIHVSTDEVFGELPLDAPEQKFSEVTLVDPRSPYSASKASSDHIVQAFHHTYGMDTVITNCSNNYGANQHEEKLIPRTINHILDRKAVVVHGLGNHVRDWIYVDDHVSGLFYAAQYSLSGSRYCFGGNRELTNLEVINYVYDQISKMYPEEKYKLLIKHTDDRPTDDERYAIDSNKAYNELDWEPCDDFEFMMRSTIKHYVIARGEA